MALTVGNKYLASEFIALKARVKAEMLRRKYTGSLVSYGSSAYDYEVQPTEGSVVLPEHVNKLSKPLNAINNTGISSEFESGDVITAIDALDTFLTKAEQYSVTSSSTDCKSSCSGLCVTGCGTSCKGCSGSCTGGCRGCSGCGDDCSSGCGGVCSTDCISACDTTCQGSCKTACTTTCYTGCKEGCKGSCKGCSGCTSCTGCTGSCKGNCTGKVSSSPV